MIDCTISNNKHTKDVAHSKETTKSIIAKWRYLCAPVAKWQKVRVGWRLVYFMMFTCLVLINKISKFTRAYFQFYNTALNNWLNYKWVMLYCVYSDTYLLIVNFQIRHANDVVPSFIFILCFNQFENLANSSGDHAWLLWTAQHGMSLTCKMWGGLFIWKSELSGQIVSTKS